MTRREYRCPNCRKIEEATLPLRMDIDPWCDECAIPMERYFGGGDPLYINYGIRAHHGDIERFQFTNL